MAPNQWLFISLPVAALSIMWGGHPWAGGLLFLVVCARVVALRVQKTLVVTGLVVFLFGGYWWWRDQRLNAAQLAPDQPQTVQQELRVQPDAVVLRGAAYYFVGQDLKTGERLTVRGFATSARELKQLRQLARPTIWQVTGEVQGILSATNFNQFDSAGYWRHRGIVKTLKVTSVRQRQATSSTVLSWFRDWWHGWRAHLSRYCEQLPGALRVYALGLLPGVKAAEAMTELQGMQRLGLLHLFAISGLHVALLLAAIEWLCVHLRIQREHWEWGMLLGLPGYFILAGGGSGVLRACWMRGLQLTGKKCRRPISTIDAWSLAFLVGLWVNPGLLFELGSQLSYGLSLGLILLKNETTFWRQAGLTLLGLPSLLTGIFQWHALTLLANWLLAPLFPLTVL